MVNAKHSGENPDNLNNGSNPDNINAVNVDGLVSSAEIEAVDGRRPSIFYLRIFYEEKEIVVMRNYTSKKKENKIFGFCKGVLVPSFAGAVYTVCRLTTTVLAAGTDTSAVTAPLENLKTLVIAIIGAVGVIILAKNVMEFAQAYQQQDSSTMNSALKGIVAGIMMAGISSVLAFLGF